MDLLKLSSQELDQEMRDKIMGRDIPEIFNIPVGQFPIATTYSTELDKAWIVVRKMLSDGWNFTLSIHAPKEQERAYSFASFTCPYGPCERHKNTEKTWHGIEDVGAETPARAICLAALKALSLTN